MTQRQKYLIGRAYDAATALSDAFDTRDGSAERLRLLDERVRTFLNCREECEQAGVPKETLKELPLSPLLKGRLPPH